MFSDQQLLWATEMPTKSPSELLQVWSLGLEGVEVSGACCQNTHKEWLNLARVHVNFGGYYKRSSAQIYGETSQTIGSMFVCCMWTVCLELEC